MEFCMMFTLIFMIMVVQGSGQKDCKTTRLGKEYRGNIDITRKGHKCQSWSSQEPNKHRSNNPRTNPHAGLTSNYCRNPDDSPEGPWCYNSKSTDPRWEYCLVFYCEPKQCLEPDELSYRGSKNVSETNRRCKKWSETKYTPKKSPHAGLEGNECRNPDDSNFQWCYLEKPYTKDSKGKTKKWEFCDIPPCGKEAGTTVSVLAYNIFGNNCDNNNRMKRLPAALMGIKHKFSLRIPDVILFQECFQENLDVILNVKLENGTLFKDIYPYNYGGERWILSKYPIMEKDMIHIKGKGYDPYAKINFGTKEHPKPVHFVSAHLPSNPGFGASKARLEAWNYIREQLIKKKIPKSEPVIIGGDFNAETLEVLQMEDAVVNYNFKKQNSFDEKGRFIPASWSGKTNWLCLSQEIDRQDDTTASQGKTYPQQFGVTLDYIVSFKPNLLPTESTEAKVLFFKNHEKWEMNVKDRCYKDIKGVYPGAKFLVDGNLTHGTFVKNPTKTNRLYDDLSDHYPIYKEYVFRFDP